MSPGKAASQAGHAFLDAYLDAPLALATAYRADGMGTKVVLSAPNEAVIRAIHDRAQQLHIPSALIIDSGHVMPPHFDGNPVVTAVGLGPATRDEVETLTGELNLLD